MKIDPTRPSAPSAAARRADASGASGFTPTSDSASTSATRGPSSIIAVPGVLALQGLDDVMGKRARAVRRGHDSLDALDRLQLGLLEGRAPMEVRGTLNRLIKEREMTGDDHLDGLMEQIDVRVAVELAKLERSAQA